VPRFLNTRGRSSLAIKLCDRCGFKFPFDEVFTDPNNGLQVCRKDLDNYDPWRLPARMPEDISLRNPRPEVSIATTLFNYLVTEQGYHIVTQSDNPLVT